MDVEALRIFVKVAELGSLTRAGDHLGIPKGQVSRRLRALEADLDVRLFHRTTRVVRLTPDGETLLPRAVAMLREADEITGLFRSGRRLRGRVRVDMPVSLAKNYVLPTLPALLERHPELELFVSTTDRIVDVLGEGFDCVLRVGGSAQAASPSLDLMKRKLGSLTMINCASRGYVERRGLPTCVDDLDAHRLVNWASRAGAEPPVFEWEEGGHTHTRIVPCSVTVNSTDGYYAACLAGLGIIQVPRIALREQLGNGEVVEVLPDYRSAPLPVTLLHSHGRRPPQRVRAVMDWIGASLAGHLA